MELDEVPGQIRLLALIYGLKKLKKSEKWHKDINIASYISII